MTKQNKRFSNTILRIAVVACLVALAIGVQMYAATHKAFLKQAVVRNTEPVAPPPLKPAVVPDTVRSHLKFAVDSLCRVNDPYHSLDAFFSELNRLARGADTVVTIVHIGDSHIQAGYLSGQTMRLMHRQYGNAGRGWISPLRIAKTNEPADYFISTVVKEWTVGRCIQSVPKTPVGPGGIGIRTVSPFVNFDLSVTPLNGAGYEFNRVVLYRGQRSMPMLPSASSIDTAEVSRSYTPPVPGVVTDTFYIDCLADKLQLQSTRRKEGTDSLLPAASFDNLYYGFNLTNGASGILYHSIGVNGAMFANYTGDGYVKKLALLNPSLLIVSLGTNETFGKRFSAAELSGQAAAFVSLARKYMPQAAILLTTPPECYKRVWVDKKRAYIRNENTERAAKAIAAVAAEEKLACWDMFAATGGKGSSKDWFNGKWMRRDRIHFTKEGYTEQGTLLFKALINLKIERERQDAGRVTD
ncbi:MAG: GDSL-type esterase/lipase family protein [Tannerellaceae bacterium]|jgi:lysophospholipase L1-like esterase|nr:GDSL-type esterase/lipase family protein [Tannerellaceae bacterium]